MICLPHLHIIRVLAMLKKVDREGDATAWPTCKKSFKKKIKNLSLEDIYAEMYKH